MKHSELIRKLKKAGCLLKRHGASHDVWLNPKTGGTEARRVRRKQQSLSLKTS